MTTVNFDFTGIGAGQELNAFEPLFPKLVNSSTNTVVGGTTAGTLSWVGASGTPTTYGYETGNVLHSFKVTYAAAGLSGSMLTCCARIVDYRNCLALRFSASTTLELVILTNSTPSLDSLWTVTRGSNDEIELIIEAGDQIRVKFSGSYLTFPSTGTTTKTITNHASGTKVGFCARSSAVANVITAAEINFQPPTSVTSINGGSAITASQTSVSAVTAGFTGLPTSITTNQTGLTCGTITGTTNAPTFVKSVRVDGQAFPPDGTTATFTFVNGAESANGTQVINKNANETKVVIGTPVLILNTIGAVILDQTGRTVATSDQFYHTTYSDLVITTDTDFTVTDDGSFELWLYVASGADAGKNYYYSITITEGVAVIDNALTSAGLTSIGLTASGLTSTGL